MSSNISPFKGVFPLHTTSAIGKCRAQCYAPLSHHTRRLEFRNLQSKAQASQLVDQRLGVGNCCCDTIYEINSSWRHRILNRLRRRRGRYVWISDRRRSDAWHCLVLADTEARALPFIILILKLCAGPYPANFAPRPGTGANLRPF